tara:strand:+ start:2314 stop:2805 length:492 start_codon:yes stop_codon:yes gene_type:complete
MFGKSTLQTAIGVTLKTHDCVEVCYTSKEPVWDFGRKPIITEDTKFVHIEWHGSGKLSDAKRAEDWAEEFKSLWAKRRITLGDLAPFDESKYFNEWHATPSSFDHSMTADELVEEAHEHRRAVEETFKPIPMVIRERKDDKPSHVRLADLEIGGQRFSTYKPI